MPSLSNSIKILCGLIFLWTTPFSCIYLIALAIAIVISLNDCKLSLPTNFVSNLPLLNKYCFKSYSKSFTRKSFLKCGNHIFQEYMNKSYTEFYTYIESSGKGMNDFGNEHYCQTGTYNENKTNYYLLYAYLENADQMTNYEDKILINFPKLIEQLENV